MITSTLRLSISIGIIVYYIIILIFLKKKALSLRYMLLWIFSGLGMSILVIFPQILEWLVHLMGIKSAVNGLFLFVIFIILVILMSVTSIVSRQNDKIKKLVQDNAFLEKRIRELEKK